MTDIRWTNWRFLSTGVGAVSEAVWSMYPSFCLLRLFSISNRYFDCQHTTTYTYILRFIYCPCQVKSRCSVCRLWDEHAVIFRIVDISLSVTRYICDTFGF